MHEVCGAECCQYTNLCVCDSVRVIYDCQYKFWLWADTLNNLCTVWMCVNCDPVLRAMCITCTHNHSFCETFYSNLFIITDTLLFFQILMSVWPILTIANKSVSTLKEGSCVAVEWDLNLKWTIWLIAEVSPYMYTHTLSHTTRTHTYTEVRTHTLSHTHSHTPHAHTHTQRWVHTCTHTHTLTHTQRWVHIYTHTLSHIHTHTHTHSHTHSHTYTHITLTHTHSHTHTLSHTRTRTRTRTHALAHARTPLSHTNTLTQHWHFQTEYICTLYL